MRFLLFRKNIILFMSDSENNQILNVEEQQTEQEQTAQEQTAQEQTAQEQTAQEQTAQEQTAQEQTTQEQTEQEQTAQEQTEQEDELPEMKTFEKEFVPPRDEKTEVLEFYNDDDEESVLEKTTRLMQKLKTYNFASQEEREKKNLVRLKFKGSRPTEES